MNDERHRQLDGSGRDKAQEGRSHEGLCPSGHAGDLSPGLEGLSPGGSVLSGGAVIAAEVEEIVDLIVSGEEALGLARRLEPLHLPLASAWCMDHGCGRTAPYPVRVRRRGRTSGVPAPACG